MTNRLFPHLSVQTLPGVGPVVADRLKRLDLYNIQDLLLYFPFRYENRTKVTAIEKIIPGTKITVEGKIIATQLVTKRQTILTCTLSDGTGILELRFMHFHRSFQSSLRSGNLVRVYGEIKTGHSYPYMIHPQWQKITATVTSEKSKNKLTPVYYTTGGVSQLTLQKAIGAALLLLSQNPPPELLPTHCLNEHCSILDALTWIHNPPALVQPEQLQKGKFPAQQRLITEELLAHQISLSVIHQYDPNSHAFACPYPKQIMHRFLNNLSYDLTAAQQRTSNEICADLQKSRPMMRLLQGDVGCGKTCVAALAALHVLANQKQVVLMAPTEILAKQHYDTFKQWFDPLGITVKYVPGGTTFSQKKTLQHLLDNQKMIMVIGTHALFYDHLNFQRLGLVIIDEQHRFGVAQRLALWQKGSTDNHFAHQLLLTATPIPRTLAMTLYAGMAVSTIDELPPGRALVTTVALPNSKRGTVLKRIRFSAEQGKQIYWVCTLVEGSEHLQAKAAEDLATSLQENLHPHRVDLIHGRMKTQKKQEIMNSFKQGELTLLVATTVIEVGVDVPNATIMVIENAERLGLAQLHQLRGRVGRGMAQSYCILLYQAPLSRTAAARLNILRASNDGFVIAQKDLEIRGFGEILGTKQRGITDFKIVDLIRDSAILQKIPDLAAHFLAESPQKARELMECWLPDKQKYIHA